MFKVGDIVVCVTNTFDGYDYYLTIGKKYMATPRYEDNNHINVMNDVGIINGYDEKFFISEIQYRKQKIEKICSRLVI